MLQKTKRIKKRTGEIAGFEVSTAHCATGLRSLRQKLFFPSYVTGRASNRQHLDCVSSGTNETPLRCSTRHISSLDASAQLHKQTMSGCPHWCFRRYELSVRTSSE